MWHTNSTRKYTSNLTIMGRKPRRSLILFLMVFGIIIETGSGIPSRRVCLEYDRVSENGLKNSTVKMKICKKSQNMCFMLLKRLVKDGRESTILLKQDCWGFENSQNETCGSTECTSHKLHIKENGEFCCCQKDLCNRKFIPVKTYPRLDKNQPTSATGSKETTQEKHLQVFTGIISVATILLVLTSAIVAMLFWKRKIKQKEAVDNDNSGTLPSSTELHVRLICPINKGKFGEIWKGTLNSRPVAIKKFHISHKSSWDNEKNIYNLGLEHHGILKFFGASIYTEKDSLVSFILVIEYHPRGSLRSCLQSASFSWQEMCKMSHSVAEALAYLHGELEFKTKKKRLCIVHRDISSENILVKEDGSCVLCDLGLSRVMSDQERHYIVSEKNQQVGSLRYMAPEALDGHINLNDIGSQLKQIDMYALGIVLWEISSRCQELYQGCVVPRYRLPFEDLANDFTVQSLKTCVYVEKKRPSFLDVWNGNEQSVQRLQELINECWDHDAEARVSASCVCHRIVELKHYHKQSPLE